MSFFLSLTINKCDRCEDQLIQKDDVYITSCHAYHLWYRGWRLDYCHGCVVNPSVLLKVSEDLFSLEEQFLNQGIPPDDFNRILAGIPETVVKNLVVPSHWQEYFNAAKLWLNR